MLRYWDRREADLRMHWGMGTSPHGNGHTRRSEFNGPSHGSVKVFNKVRKEEEREREREREGVCLCMTSTRCNTQAGGTCYGTRSLTNTITVHHSPMSFSIAVLPYCRCRSPLLLLIIVRR